VLHAPIGSLSELSAIKTLPRKLSMHAAVEYALGIAQIGMTVGSLTVADQWTGSAFLPYPGFRTDAAAVGEYNGKFMPGQFVLRAPVV
jgi:hypothetical protein